MTYLTKIPRLRRIKNWPNLVKILKDPKNSHCETDHTGIKCKYRYIAGIASVKFAELYTLADWIGPLREERMKYSSCSPNFGLEWRKSPTRGLALDPPTPIIAGSRPNNKQLVYIALSSSISLSFSLSIVITNPTPYPNLPYLFVLFLWSFSFVFFFLFFPLFPLILAFLLYCCCCWFFFFSYFWFIPFIEECLSKRRSLKMFDIAEWVKIWKSRGAFINSKNMCRWWVGWARGTNKSRQANLREFRIPEARARLGKRILSLRAYSPSFWVRPDWIV